MATDTDDVLTQRWKFVGEREKMNGYCVEDSSIFTFNDVEVLGCSESIRCDVETLEHIIDIHNKWLDWIDFNSKSSTK